MSELTKLQKNFAFEYIKDMDPTSAALRAGYKEDFAQKNAFSLLNNKKILEEIEQNIEINSQKMILHKAFFVKKFQQILNYASVIEEVKDKNGVPTGSFKMSDVGAALKSLEHLFKLANGSVSEKSEASSINIGNLDVDRV